MADSIAPTSSIAPSTRARSLSRSRISTMSTRRPSFTSYLRWSKSMRMSPKTTDTLLTIAIGLGLRYIIDTISHHSVKVTGSIIGLWEGVIMLHFTKKAPKSSDPLVAFGARLVVDFVCTESVQRQVLVLLWMWLGMVLADVLPAIWSDKRVRRARRRLDRKVRSLSFSLRVPTLVLSPPVHRTIRFVPSNDLHTITEESTQVSAAPSVVLVPDVNDTQPEAESPVTPQVESQPETAVHAPLIAIIPVIQDAVAALSASQQTPVLQLSDFLPPVGSPYEETQNLSPTEKTPTQETYTPPIPLPNVDALPAGHGAAQPEAEPTEHIKPSINAQAEVPNIEDIEEIVLDEADDAEDPVPAVLRQSSTSTPLYSPDAQDHLHTFGGSPPPQYQYDLTYALDHHGDPLRTTRSPSPDHVLHYADHHDHDHLDQHPQYDARSIPIYDINDLAEIQDDAADIFIPPSFSKSRSPSPTPEFNIHVELDKDEGEDADEDAGNMYIPPTPPESTIFKRRKLSHHEHEREHDRLPEGYFSSSSSRPVPRRQESKALPPVPPPDDYNDDANSDDIYVDEESVPPIHVEVVDRPASVASVPDGWEKVDLADYAFVPPTHSAQEGEDDSPSSYGAPQHPGQQYFAPPLAPSQSQESDQELKALVHDLGPLIH